MKVVIATVAEKGDLKDSVRWNYPQTGLQSNPPEKKQKRGKTQEER